MSKLLLQDLIARLESELYRLHYTEQSIKIYRRMWKPIVAFFESEGADHFTEEVGRRFMEKQYSFFELEKSGELTQ